MKKYVKFLNIGLCENVATLLVRQWMLSVGVWVLFDHGVGYVGVAMCLCLSDMDTLINQFCMEI